ncbi:MAG: hypothetical protein NW208_14245 [Bryobacter sp.]|nr:hypothetical protein [Bryobacter sp.]
MLKRISIFAYGTVAYVFFLATFLYAIGFIGNLGVPKSIDSPADNTPLGLAVLINAGLLTVFALQHSIMARAWFKEKWTRIVPMEMERSTFVLATCAALGLLYWQWRPLGGEIWNIQDQNARMAILGLYGFGFALVLVSTCLIDHFDLFGMRQVWLALQGKPYTHHRFQIKSLYRYVRHPLYLGFVIAFWAAPTMTAARLFFALITTAYIVTAIQFEESDLVRQHGNPYARYRSMVPMLIPRLLGKTDSGGVQKLIHESQYD